MSTKNIVLFGETGAGKSSVVNLMAGKEIAKTSRDVVRCTMHWEKYSITFDGCNYNVFDTMGLETPGLKIEECLDAIVNARSLVMKLRSEDGIDLLIFCVRAKRLDLTIQNNYRLFYEWLCEKKFPIVLVITGLEQKRNMEDWWAEHKVMFDRYDIVVDGHACITAASYLDGRHQQLYEESRQLVRNLVKEHTHDRRDGTSKGDERWKEDEELKEGTGNGWFKRFTQKLGSLLGSPRALNTADNATILIKRCGMPPRAARYLARRISLDGAAPVARYFPYTCCAVAHDDRQMSAKNIVLFGQAGAGKTSVVNLMAGEEKAFTFPGMERCTMQWKEYPIAFDGFEYKVFEAVGLNGLRRGDRGYSKAIANARHLIMKLKKKGGIDLLIFCVRADERRSSATLRENYWLFYESLCKKKIPIVLVLTGLEGEKNMEDGWTRCKDFFDKHNIIVDGHACITAARDPDGRYQQLSRQLVRSLVKEHTHRSATSDEGTWRIEGRRRMV